MNTKTISRRIRALWGASVLLLALAPVIQAGEGKIRPAKNPVANEYLVVLNDDVFDVPAMAADVAKKHDGRVQRVWKHAVRGFHVVMPEGRALAMSRDPRVQWVEENQPIFQSAVQPTTDTVAGCLGGTAACTHNRLWHLDRLDSASAVQDNTFKSCSTGDGVAIYIVDSGVHRAHPEFGTKLENGVQVPRVRDGFNATVRYDANGNLILDQYGEPIGDHRNPPYAPCGASVYLPSNPTADELVKRNQEIGEGGHGTSVASIAAGSNVGVARDAWIVPVKVFRCDGHEAREWRPSTAYAVGDRIGINSVQWVAVQAGTSGTNGNIFSYDLGAISNDGTVRWKTVLAPAYETAGDALTGLEWILSENNPDRAKPGVVNMSMYLNNPTTTVLSTFETGVRNLIGAGLIVVTSANNQDENACNRSPARMSPGNPNVAVRSNVVTVGGTMIRNNPEINSQNQAIFRGDGSGIGYLPGKEPIPAAGTTPTDARWRCAAGDSSACASDEVGAPASNWGSCVSVFAPAKNVTSARIGGTNQFRDRLGKHPDALPPAASGTSFASPAVAGIAALFLQHAPGATVEDFHNALQLNGVSGQLEDSTLFPLSGSPNLMARAVGLFAYKMPTSHTVTQGSNVTLNFPVSGPGTKTYQWYRGVPGNVSQSTSIGTDPGSITFQPPSTGTYWVRITASACSDALNVVDSTAFNVTVNAPAIAPPTGVSATTSSPTTVVVSWTPAANVVSYVIERATTFGGTYTALPAVTGSSHTDAPPATAAYQTYVYRVRSKDSAGNLSTTPSAADYATVRSLSLFTDDPLVVNATRLNPSHVTELRAAINAVRAAAGLGAVTGATPAALNAAELNTLRGALDAARAAMGLGGYPYLSDPVSGQFLRLAHFSTMRDSVK